MVRKNTIEFTVEVIDRASKALAKIQSRFGKLASAIARNARNIATLVGVMAGAFLLFINNTTEAFARLERVADNTDVAVEKISALAYAAELSGGNLNTLQSSADRMAKALFDATDGIGESADALRVLNVNAKDLLELNFDQQLIVLADAFRNVENRTMRSALAQTIFGGNAEVMLKIMDRGSDGIREYATQLQMIGGEVTESAAASSRRFRDALVDLKSAIDGIGRAIVDSGIVDWMTDVINEAVRMVAVLNRASRAGLELRQAQILESIRDMQEHSAIGDSEEFWDLPGVRTLQAELDVIKEKLSQIKDIGVDFGTPEVGEAIPLPPGSTSTKRNPLESWLERFEHTEVRLQKQLNNLRQAIAEGLIPTEAEQKRIRDEILAMFTVDEIDVQAQERTVNLADYYSEAFDFMAAAAESAAQSMQSSLADFFMNAEGGAKGLLKSFLEVIRRMLAEVAAFQTLQLFGIGDFFNGLVGRAGGGPVSGGRPYLVGERGPELFVPGASGNIVPNNRLGGGGMSFQPITNIDARGADPGLIARLPKFIEDRDRRLLMLVQRYVETGVMPVV